MGLPTTVEMAEKWKLSRRRIAGFCKEGRIECDVLKGKTWLIPENAEKPTDPSKKRHLENNLEKGIN